MPPPENKPIRVYQYDEIARQIRLQIRRGAFRHDGRIPSERELCKQYNVQRGTIRHALEVLEREGAILTDPKRGSYIRPPQANSEKNVFLLGLPARSQFLGPQITEEFTRVAGAAGFTVKRFDSTSDLNASPNSIPLPADLAPDVAAVAFWPQAPTPIETLFRLNELVPVVLLDRRLPGLTVDYVRFDDYEGACSVTEHLLQQGHRKIVFLADEAFVETVQHRWLGYAAALEAAGEAVDPRFSLFFHRLHEPIFSMTIGQILSWGEDRPTAFVCSNDLVAFSLMRVVREIGMRVPEDVVVTGFSNVMSEYLDAVQLTSVDQSFSTVGRIAAEILVKRVGQSREDRMLDPTDVLIPTRLVVRKSSLRPS